MRARLKALKIAIMERYKTPYAFWRNNPEVKRSTLYMILNGKYPGDLEKQLTKLEILLKGEPEPLKLPVIKAKEAYSILQKTKCVHCRKIDKRFCPECNTQTMREAEALEKYVQGG